jgi:hypothetical protein
MNENLKKAFLQITEKSNRNLETAKAFLETELETKSATSPMATNNTGYGAELVNSVIYGDELYSMIAQDKANIFSMLP